jgi:16S rRNA (guanine966-N2)-methyltransferase
VSRIIAGSRGGRRIGMPRGDRTRPTTDRVREALFSAIAAWANTGMRTADQALAGLGFCDLYAGSGAVGLEAASRGADPVLLVEADRRTAEVARRNAAELDLAAQVRATRVEALIRLPAPRAYDVVFADPPYDLSSDVVGRQLSDLVELGWVSEPGLVVVERSRRTPDLSWPVAITERWQRSYGETVLHYGAR